MVSTGQPLNGIISAWSLQGRSRRAACSGARRQLLRCAVFRGGCGAIKLTIFRFIFDPGTSNPRLRPNKALESRRTSYTMKVYQCHSDTESGVSWQLRWLAPFPLTYFRKQLSQRSKDYIMGIYLVFIVYCWFWNLSLMRFEVYCNDLIWWIISVESFHLCYI